MNKKEWKWKCADCVYRMESTIPNDLCDFNLKKKYRKSKDSKVHDIVDWIDLRVCRRVDQKNKCQDYKEKQ